MLTKAQVEARIAELEAERVRLVEAANQRLAQIAGELAVWREVLESVTQEEEEVRTDDQPDQSL